MSLSILEMAKDLVQAQIMVGQLPPEDMQEALHKTYASLMALKTLKETDPVPLVQDRVGEHAPTDWRQSIARDMITCLECGTTFKQLSFRHLQVHGLDGRSYRAKYGIPRIQPLSARSVTALRKTIAQRARPWEKTRRYMKAQEGKTERAAPAKTSRTRRTRTPRAKG